MSKARKGSIVIIILSLLLLAFVYFSQVQTGTALSKFKFKLGLDLQGGTHLVYKADVSALAPSDAKGSVDALRDVIERRVNLFGVSEPLVQTETFGGLSSEQGGYRLIVELPGVTDVKQAISLIGETPTLEFKLQRPEAEQKERIALIEDYKKQIAAGKTPTKIDPRVMEDPNFAPTGLTGRYLKKSQVDFNQSGGKYGIATPSVALEFDSTGAEMFKKITGDNIGKILAIYLDGAPISTPVINSAIPDGKAIITGTFSADEAKILVGRLNSGALPVPIELVSTQKIGATLGADALNHGLKAGIVGIILVALFLILWYRLPGLIAVLALCVYVLITLFIFKLFGFTLTAAGIVGFIISVGMAVDANVLIFERMKEELQSGKDLNTSIDEGFKRAWASIRDSNISSILTALVLFWFGTSLIKGFALTFGLGVIISMFSAITVTRTFLRSLSIKDSHTTMLKMFKGAKTQK